MWYVIFWIVKKLACKIKFWTMSIFIIISIGFMVYFFSVDSKCFEQSFSFLFGITLASIDEEKVKKDLDCMLVVF